jgi:hypothetical protein
MNTSAGFWCSDSGLSFLLFPKDRSLATAAADNPEGLRPSFWRIRLIGVATAVGLISGLLANAGGFLLVPSYTELLTQPTKKAFACSLAVSSVLAVPGTVFIAYLGHISWAVTGIVALGSLRGRLGRQHDAPRPDPGHSRIGSDSRDARSLWPTATDHSLSRGLTQHHETRSC